MTPEERQEIINEAAEKALLMLPEAIGNLISNHAALAKANKEFYLANPELSQHRDLVVSVIEELEGNNSELDYPEILNKSAELAKQRLNISSTLDYKVTKSPNRNIFSGDDRNGII